MGNGKLERTLEERQAQVETQVEGLSVNVAHVIATIDKLSQTVSKGFSELHERITSQSKINWTPIGAFLAIGSTIIIAFTSMVFAFYGRDVGRVEANVGVLNESRVAVAEQRGRNDVTRDWLRNDADRLLALFDKCSDWVEKRMGDLDTALQREINQVNATTEAKIAGMDRRVQDEISRNAEERRVRIAELQTAVNQLNEFQQNSTAIHADLLARIKNEEQKP